MKLWRIIIVVLIMLTAGCSSKKIDLAFSNDMISIDGTINDIENKATDDKTETRMHANITITNKNDAPVIVDLSNVALNIDSQASTGIFYDKPDSAINKLVYIKKGKTFVADVYWVFNGKIEADSVTAELML